MYDGNFKIKIEYINYKKISTEIAGKELSFILNKTYV